MPILAFIIYAVHIKRSGFRIKRTSKTFKAIIPVVEMTGNQCKRKICIEDYHTFHVEIGKINRIQFRSIIQTKTTQLSIETAKEIVYIIDTRNNFFEIDINSLLCIAYH